MNAEKIYEIWHREIFRAQNKNVRKIKNFSKAKEKSTWKYFEKFSYFVERNNGFIDVDLYMESIAQYYEGYFDPALLGKQSTIKIYNDYKRKKSREEENSEQDIRSEIMKSLKFVINFCKKHNIKNLSEYIMHDSKLIPSILKHYNAGSISMYFIACIENFPIILTNFPNDVLYDYTKGFNNKYELYRIRIVSNKNIKKIAQRIHIIVETVLKTINKKKKEKLKKILKNKKK